MLDDVNAMYEYLIKEDEDSSVACSKECHVSREFVHESHNLTGQRM